MIVSRSPPPLITLAWLALSALVGKSLTFDCFALRTVFRVFETMAFSFRTFGAVSSILVKSLFAL